MKQARLLYDNNQQAINRLLIQKGFKPTYNDLMNAVKDLGDAFLVEIYNDITANFDEASGNFWGKFKSIFHKAADAINTTGNVSALADNLINPAQHTATNTITPAKDRSTWKPNLIWWGAGAVCIIIILLLIYIFKK